MLNFYFKTDCMLSDLICRSSSPTTRSLLLHYVSSPLSSAVLQLTFASRP